MIFVVLGKRMDNEPILTIKNLAVAFKSGGKRLPVVRNVSFQLEKGEIKNVNSKAISVMCFSIIFQSTILWQIYGNNADMDSDIFADDYLDIIFNGIKP